MPPPYLKPGLTLSSAVPGPDVSLIRALQTDLRALGYLSAGIDGAFGAGTERAVQALQYDLLHNQGTSLGNDGSAPVAVASYNIARNGTLPVSAPTGILDQALAGCIDAMLSDGLFPKLPRSADPGGDNRRALAALSATPSTVAPTPFIRALVMQESGARQYSQPNAGDHDDFVIVGCDHNDPTVTYRITSRGYGLGQYTLFHHPPQPTEVSDFVLDPVRNAQRAYAELREKFDQAVIGPPGQPQLGADDRTVEHPMLPLRQCKYAPGDPLYLRDCVNCARAARRIDIARGAPVYRGASIGYQPSQYYATADYHGVPDRADFPCDWPYAVRRYNGGGMNSYHYQIRVLLNLLAEPNLTGG